MIDRIDWLDKCKLIGIWLVILGHLNISKDIQSFIYAFHMPLFFFISGYLYKIPKNNFSQLKKNVSGLLWPYFTFYILNWLLCFILFYALYTMLTGNNNITLSNTFIKPLFGMLYGVGYDTENSNMLLRPMWFLVALFIMKTTFDFITKFTKKDTVIMVISLFFCLVSQLLVRLNIDLYWSVDSAFTAMPFFGFGFIFKRLNVNFNIFNKTRYINFIIVSLIFLILYFLSKINGSVDINGNIIGNYSFLFFLNAILGIIGIIILSQQNFQLNGFFTYLSQNTLLILFLHYIFILVIFKIIPHNYMSDIIYFVFSIVILVSMYFPVLFINKYFPFLIVPVFKKKIL